MLINEAKKILNDNGYLVELKKYRTSAEEREARDIDIDHITKAKQKFIDDVKSIIDNTGICFIDYTKWYSDDVAIILGFENKNRKEFIKFIGILNKLIKTNKFGKIFNDEISNNTIRLNIPEEKNYDVTQSIITKFRTEVAEMVADRFYADEQVIFDNLEKYNINCLNWKDKLIEELAWDITHEYGGSVIDELLECIDDVCKKLAPKYEKYVKHPKTISNKIHFEKYLNEIISIFKQAINIAAKETKLTTN